MSNERITALIDAVDNAGIEGLIQMDASDEELIAIFRRALVPSDAPASNQDEGLLRDSWDAVRDVLAEHDPFFWREHADRVEAALFDRRASSSTPSKDKERE